MKAQCKKRVLFFGLIPLCTLLSGCGKYYLSLTQQNVDATYLASTHVATPDPRQAHPPTGEMIIMDWRVPKKLLKEHPTIDLHVVYWNYTEKTFSYPISSRMGYVTYKDLDKEFTDTKGILTYKADLKTADGKVYREWKHQLWVNLITLDETNTPSSQTNKESTSAISDNVMDESSYDQYPEDEQEREDEEQAEEDIQRDEEDSEDSDEEDQPASDEDSEDNAPTADNMSSFVDDQSMQGSVTDTEDFTDETSSDSI